MAPRAPGAPSRAAALALGIALLLALPLPATAQYMYLDSNGDGIHSSADVVAPSGTSTVEVWLVTDRNRDGTPAVCPYDGDFTINSYEVILHASNGGVTWGALTNLIPQFTIDLGTVASGADAHVAFASGTILPPGTYRLARVGLSVAFGTPSIAIANTTPLSPVYGTTFGSQCIGLDFDNTLKLGSDWFDVDGLAYGGVANMPPVVDPVADMSVSEAEVAEQVIHAVDSEGGTVTFAKVGGPSYMTVTTTSGGPGSADGLIRLEPDYSASGTAVGVVGASDGTVTGVDTFEIAVTNVPRAPVLGPVSNMTDVADGNPHVQMISATDPDNEASQIHFSIASGPPWVTALTHVAIGLNRIDGEIHVNPFPAVASGDYNVLLVASKATVADSAAFVVTVTAAGGNQGPLIQSIPNLSVAAGTTLEHTFTVVDPEGDVITLSKAAGPAYMTVTRVVQFGTTTFGRVTLSPDTSDVGAATGYVRASDGALFSTVQFGIVVYRVTPGGTMLSFQGDPDDGISQGQTYLYEPPSAEFTVRQASTTAVNLSVRGLSSGDYWFVDFSVPDSGSLTPGFYPDAIRFPFNGTSPGLAIYGQGRGCNTLTGLFEIKQAVVGTNGALESFWARFEQHCEGAVAGLTGEIRINASAEVAVTAPLSRRAMIGDEVTFQVSATSASGAEIAILALGLPEGADFLNHGDGTGTLTWRPAVPLEPTQVVFEARDLAGHVDRSTTLLTATSRITTTLSLYSDPGDPVGTGIDRTFSGPEIYLFDDPSDPNRVLFSIQSGFPWHIYFRAADNGRILPGVYDGTTGEVGHTPGTPTLQIFNAQQPLCGPVAGRFEVVEAAYDGRGVLSRFHAYFTQHCGDPTRSITGEIRWRAMPGADVVVPVSRAVQEGDPTSILATGFPGAIGGISYRIESPPLGATFSDLGDNTARLDWTPGFTQSGIYTPRLIATHTNGATASIPLRINVVEGSRRPVADAGGPYEGIVGRALTFDGSGSSDPDGDPLSYVWDFGDSSGIGLVGPTPFHTYAAVGVYQVVLYVYDAAGFTSADTDTTTASIHADFGSRMFVAHGNRDIRLASGKPVWCAQVEPLRASFPVNQVILSDCVLISDSTSGTISRISAIEGKSAVGRDTDGNGVDEVTACFAKGDLQQLFAYVSGRSVERVTVEGRLLDGSSFRATMQIEVVGSSGKTALAATPNPLNPETVLTYYLPGAAHARIRVFDVSGRLVSTLVDEAAGPGYHTVRWSPGSGRIASGVYYARLETGRERRTIRLVVLK